MRQWLRTWIPSMFQRRLAVLTAIGLALGLVLLTQLTRLTIFQHDQWRQVAERAMADRHFVATVRGRIVDAKGRVLAEDKPSFDICINYSVISGRWAVEQAFEAARKSNRQRWHRLDPADRERLIAEYQPVFEEQIEDLWRQLAKIGGLSRQEIEERRQVIRQRVEEVAADVWLTRLETRLAQGDENVAMSEIIRPVGEQKASHPILMDVDDDARLWVQRKAAAAMAADIHGGEIEGEQKNVDADSSVNPAAAEIARRPTITASQKLAIWLMVEVERSWRREYPWEKVEVKIDRSYFPGELRQEASRSVVVESTARHVLGNLRSIYKEDEAASRRPFQKRDEHGQLNVDLGGYRPGDLIGGFGIEKLCESSLRGMRGEFVEFLDTQAKQRTDPLPGQEVVLSLDVQLQARVAAIMQPELGLMKRQPWHFKDAGSDPHLGEPLCGAAVVLDISSGRILAAVSTPGIPVKKNLATPENRRNEKINRPYLNRVIGQLYEPGSTVKPLVLAAAMTERKLLSSEQIVCRGQLDPRKQGMRCWIFKQGGQTHGPLGGAEAIARSCNIFFYTMGQRLGAAGLLNWYTKFGLGKSTGCGLLEEVGQGLPRVAEGASRSGYSDDEARLWAIGQDKVRWTLLQAANSYATLARGGYAIQPTLVVSVGGKESPPGDGVDLRLDPAAVEQAFRGMDQAVNQSFGTGNHLPGLHGELVFNIEGVHVWGKSGTADATALRIDSNGDGKITAEDEVVRDGDHAWFIGLVGPKGASRPRYVIAVVAEYAGSGGHAAGPIANQILHALRAEGYL